jgi:hypothetical protein
MLIWACKETGGGMNTTLIKTGNKISGSAYSWAFLSGMNVRADRECRTSIVLY